MELHLDRSFNYQAGGQFWNVDFAKLPGSVQTEALAALRGVTPAGIITLGQLKEQFPEAFTRVSSARTLPAPDLSLSRGVDASLLGAGVDMLLALLFNKVQETGVEMSATGRRNAVALSKVEMDFADAAKLEKDSAAVRNMAGQVVSGAVSMGAGAGSFGVGAKSGFDSIDHNKAMKQSSASQRETQDYQQKMERNVKGLQDQAQADRSLAQRLDGYADEIDTRGALSDASRQKLDKELQEKADQLVDCDDQHKWYDKSIAEAKSRSEDSSVSEAQKAEAKQEWTDLQQEKRDLSARQERLKNDQQALTAVKRMDADCVQFKVDVDRLKTLRESGVRTPAEEVEMHKLEKGLEPRTQQVKDDRAVIQRHVDRLKGDASRMEESARSLHKDTQNQLSYIRERHADVDKEISQQMDENKNRVTAASAGFQAISGSGQAFGAIPQMLGQKDQAEADHIDALAKFFGVSRETARAFADQLKEMSDSAREGLKAMMDQENELTKAIGGRIA